MRKRSPATRLLRSPCLANPSCPVRGIACVLPASGCVIVHVCVLLLRSRGIRLLSMSEDHFYPQCQLPGNSSLSGHMPPPQCACLAGPWAPTSPMAALQTQHERSARTHAAALQTHTRQPERRTHCASPLQFSVPRAGIRRRASAGDWRVLPARPATCLSSCIPPLSSLH